MSLPISGAFLTLSVFELTLLILGLHCSFSWCYKLPFSFWFVHYPLLLHSPLSLFLNLWPPWDIIILLITLCFHTYSYFRIVPYSWDSYPLICSQTLRQLNSLQWRMQEDLMPANMFFKRSYCAKWGDISDIVANQESVLIQTNLVFWFTLSWMPVNPKVMSLSEWDSHIWVKVSWFLAFGNNNNVGIHLSNFNYYYGMTCLVWYALNYLMHTGTFIFSFPCTAFRSVPQWHWIFLFNLILLRPNCFSETNCSFDKCSF